MDFYIIKFNHSFLILSNHNLPNLSIKSKLPLKKRTKYQISYKIHTKKYNIIPCPNSNIFY